MPVDIELALVAYRAAAYVMELGYYYGQCAPGFGGSL